MCHRSAEGVQVAFCGCKVVDLTRECIKILGIYFSYNSSLAGNKNFMDSVANVEWLLAIWSMGSLRVAGRIQVFKSLAVSKILYVAGMNLVPIGVFEQILKQLPETLPKFYSGLIQTWCETIAYDPVDIAEVLFEHLWYNRHHKISNKPFIFYPFESVCINHVADLFIDQHQIHWPSVKSKFNLAEKLHFKWLQLVKVISDKWANIIKTGIGSTQGLNNEILTAL